MATIISFRRRRLVLTNPSASVAPAAQSDEDETAGTSAQNRHAPPRDDSKRFPQWFAPVVAGAAMVGGVIGVFYTVMQIEQWITSKMSEASKRLEDRLELLTAGINEIDTTTQLFKTRVAVLGGYHKKDWALGFIEGGTDIAELPVNEIPVYVSQRMRDFASSSMRKFDIIFYDNDVIEFGDGDNTYISRIAKLKYENSFVSDVMAISYEDVSQGLIVEEGVKKILTPIGNRNKKLS